jgi:hypothetical protein
MRECEGYEMNKYMDIREERPEHFGMNIREGTYQPSVLVKSLMEIYLNDECKITAST